MVSYKLIYFPVRGRAELARLMFAYSGQAYTNETITGEEWKAKKDSSPFGQMPILEVDGVQYCQSGAINRFLARELGLAGKDSKEEMRIDMIGGCLEDIMKIWPFGESDEEKVKAGLAKMVPLFEKVEKLLVQNNSGNGFFASKLSAADLGLFCVVDFLTTKKPDMLATTPKLAALAERVRNLPKIKEWISKRPDSKF